MEVEDGVRRMEVALVAGGRGGAAAGTASAGARTHDGELITHIISPQIDAAFRHNWRFSRCLRADVSISIFCMLCLCVCREWAIKERESFFFSLWTQNKTVPFFCSYSRSSATGYFVMSHASVRGQKWPFDPFCRTHLQHVLHFPFKKSIFVA